MTIQTCRICGVNFILQPGKPGRVDECLEHSQETVELLVAGDSNDQDFTWHVMRRRLALHVFMRGSAPETVSRRRPAA
jgi:hypothetical protein